jgi:hypothetical protein
MTIDTTDVHLLQGEQELLRRHLKEALEAVDRRARRYRRIDTVLVIVALMSGALVTLLGADAATGGTRVAQRVAETSTGRTPPPLGPGWRNVCGLMAIIAFAGTVATGLNSGLKVADGNARAFACAGVLNSLLIETTGLANLGPSGLERIRTELARTHREYPQFFR